MGTFSSSFIGDPVLHPMDDCEHPLLYLPGTGRASQETALSGSCQQALVGICNSIWVWWWFMWWILRWGSFWMVTPSVSAPHFVSVTSSVGILFTLLRRIDVSIFCPPSSWVSCVLQIVSWVFWASGLIFTYQWVHITCAFLWLCYLNHDDILQIYPFL